MKNLEKWQIISFLSRGIAMAFGLVQSFFILRFLTRGEWGIIQIASSIGGAFGIYQHLGLASGSTREISAAKNDTEVFKIFCTAASIRYLMTIPIAISLFFFAKQIMQFGGYNQEALIMPIKVYALVLLAQGVQSILNSVISGTQRFKRLFLYQSLIAVVSVFVYIPLTYLYRINGYFYALLLFNIISSFVLGYLAFKPLKFKFALPSKADFSRLFKDLVSISVAIYIVKVIYTLWEKSGPLVLGHDFVQSFSPEKTADLVGIFAFGMLYAKKLLAISDAVTDVNLPVFSEKYVKDFNNFKQLFTKNFDRIFVLIMFISMFAVYWAPEVSRFALGGSKYDASFPLILPLVFAFVFYSFINIIKSSVYIPAKMNKEMIGGFVGMIVITLGFYYITRGLLGYLPAFSYGMLVGALFGFLGMSFLGHKKIGFNFVKHDHILIIVQVFAVCAVSFEEALLSKLLAFILFLGLYACSIYISKFVTKEETLYLVSKLFKK